MATKPQAARAARPARAIAALILLLIGLSTLVYTQHWKPRQGLDLVGGTSVILTPKTKPAPAR